MLSGGDGYVDHVVLAGESRASLRHGHADDGEFDAVDAYRLAYGLSTCCKEGRSHRRAEDSYLRRVRDVDAAEEVSVGYLQVPDGLVVRGRADHRRVRVRALGYDLLALGDLVRVVDDVVELAYGRRVVEGEGLGAAACAPDCRSAEAP